MLHQKLRKVNAVLFAKQKMNLAVSRSEGAAEGGRSGSEEPSGLKSVGGIPPRPSAEAPPLRPNTWRAEPSRKISSSFLEEKNRARAKSRKRRIFFCEVAAGALAEAGGGAGQSVLRSKKVRAKDIISPPIETSRFERVAPRGRETAALRKIPRRFAANWLAGQKSNTADLSISYLKTI